VLTVHSLVEPLVQHSAEHSVGRLVSNWVLSKERLLAGWKAVRLDKYLAAKRVAPRVHCSVARWDNYWVGHLVVLLVWSWGSSRGKQLAVPMVAMSVDWLEMKWAVSMGSW
jgi:hypothetical protein